MVNKISLFIQTPVRDGAHSEMLMLTLRGIIQRMFNAGKLQMLFTHPVMILRLKDRLSIIATSSSLTIQLLTQSKLHQEFTFLCL